LMTWRLQSTELLLLIIVSRAFMIRAVDPGSMTFSP
jgi:hypothetical protein